MANTMIPFGTLRSDAFGDFRREMDDLMNRMFIRDRGNGSTQWFNPSANVSETENHYEVTLDLPGISPDEVNVEWRQGELWITGERKREEVSRRSKAACS